MNKKVLSLALTALLTVTQFNVVKASSKGVIAETTNGLKANEEIINKPIEDGKPLEEKQLKKEPIKEEVSGKKESVKEAINIQAPTVKEEGSEQSAKIQEVSEQELKIGQTVKGILDENNQAITYKVQLATAGALSINYHGYIYNSSIEIIDGYGVTIDSDSIYNSGTSSTWTTSKDVLPGTYYITVTSWYSGYFYLTANHLSANTNEIEPNNDISTAQKIEPNAKDINGFISVNDNIDVYKVEVAKNGLYLFDFESKINNVNFELSDDKGSILFYRELEKYYEEEVPNSTYLKGLTPGTYYLKINKVEQSTGSYKIKVKSYVKDGWNKLDNGDYVYYEAAKNSLKTEWIQYQGGWYYLNPEGIMQTGLSEIKGQFYYFNKSGAMQTGWVNAYGTWYYFTAGGAAKEGWLKQGSNWYYIDYDGEMCKKLKYVEGKPYYFGNDGVMKTGWIKDGNDWYYFEANGAAKINKWFKSGSNWYYFDYYGRMVTTGAKIDNKIYYFGGDGVMRTGWQRIEGAWYYFNEGGDMHLGWKLLNGKWYYMHSTEGYMVTGGWYIGGKWYYFDSNGVLQ